MLPSVRLAFAAIGSNSSFVDPASTFMRARYSIVRELGRLEGRAHRAAADMSELARLLTEVEALAGRCPDDERPARLRANLLVRLGRYTEAAPLLRVCIDHPMSQHFTVSGARYDLACVLARTGRPDDCRSELAACLALDPQHAGMAAADADFESVREADWFATMLTDAREAGGSFPSAG
jgi:hypothetical protein